MSRLVVILLVLTGSAPLLYVVSVNIGLRSAASVQEIPIYALCFVVAARILRGRTIVKVAARTVAIIGILFAAIAITVGVMPFQESLQAAKSVGWDYPIGLNFFLANTIFPQGALVALLLTAFLRWPEQDRGRSENRVLP